MNGAKIKFANAVNNNKHICVGLDTDINKIPDYIKKYDNPILEFNKIVIEHTKDFAGSYKLNFAFYESLGNGGMKILEDTLKYIPTNILTIGDAKRGDIGNTSKMYAKSIYESFGFDSVTLNPYMGIDSIEPFLDYTDNISFILVLTSNKSANDFEKLVLNDGKYLYQNVLDKVNNWNKNNNCGIVFGATNIDELKQNISNFDNLYVLLPGVGAQGGSLEDIVKTFNEHKLDKYQVNISRALIYCDSSNNFANKLVETISTYNKIIESFS